MFYYCSMLPKDLKFGPGQRIRISEQALGIVPDYVGIHGHIGIGGINATHYFRGSYFVSIRLPTGAKVVLHLPEDCLEDGQTEYRL